MQALRAANRNASIASRIRKTEDETQGPASQRTATGAAEGERAGFAQPRGVGGHPAAHGFEGGERGGDREAVGAAVWFFARPGAGFVERIGEGKRTGTGQGGHIGRGLHPCPQTGQRRIARISDARYAGDSRNSSLTSLRARV